MYQPLNKLNGEHFNKTTLYNESTFKDQVTLNHKKDLFDRSIIDENVRVAALSDAREQLTRGIAEPCAGA